MYNKRKGSMAAFSFRLLLAELPTYLGAPKVSMDKLTELVAICAEVRSCRKLCWGWHLIELHCADKTLLWHRAKRRLRLLVLP